MKAKIDANKFDGERENVQDFFEDDADEATGHGFKLRTKRGKVVKMDAREYTHRLMQREGLLQ